MDKVKPKLLPGKWEVIGSDNGLLKLKQGKNELKVNRWMVKNTIPLGLRWNPKRQNNKNC